MTNLMTQFNDTTNITPLNRTLAPIFHAESTELVYTFIVWLVPLVLKHHGPSR